LGQSYIEILKELDQSERDILREKHGDHHLFRSHIEPVLDKTHCFQVNIFAKDYDEILIHAGLPPFPITGNSPYQTLAASIRYVKLHQDFLATTRRGVLDGQTVKAYVTKLTAYQGKLVDCFNELGDCFMLDKSVASDSFRNEITDGMHRLVAYGLAADMSASHFPIPIYFGTNKTSVI
jgi:hypothetical protein